MQKLGTPAPAPTTAPSEAAATSLGAEPAVSAARGVTDEETGQSSSAPPSLRRYTTNRWLSGAGTAAGIACAVAVVVIFLDL